MVAWGACPWSKNPKSPARPSRGRPSKSARKREASSLQELGVKLSALPDQEIKELDLPDNLFVALCDLQRLPSHGAQVRQRQYIGKLMRNIDPEPVLAKLAETQAASRLGNPALSSKSSAGATGCCRTRAGAVPSCCRSTRGRTAGPCRGFLHKAERERQEQRSPGGARELFAFLRQLLG